MAHTRTQCVEDASLREIAAISRPGRSAFRRRFSREQDQLDRLPGLSISLNNNARWKPNRSALNGENLSRGSIIIISLRSSAHARVARFIAR